MKKFKINNAFTLTEMMIVMFIVGIIAVAALPAITKFKTKTPSQVQHGQYACWYDKGLHQQYATERTPKPVENLAGPNCTFKLSKKPSYYLIYAVGGGVTNSPASAQGQFVSSYVSKLEDVAGISQDETSITIGAPGQDTSFGTMLTAHGGKTGLTNDLIQENVRSCMLVTAGKKCQTAVALADIIPNTGTQQSCQLIKSNRISLSGQEELVVRINGCVMTHNDVETLQMIRLDQFNKAATGSDIKYAYISPDGDTFEIRVELFDSSYVPVPNRPSLMAELLKTLPQLRRTAISDEIVKIKPGIENRYGAVFVMW